MKSQAILILGMHRSGTSMLSSILERLGVQFGSDMLPPMPGVNEKGFWEHRKVVEAHERLLRNLDRSWYDLKPFQEGWESSSAATIFKAEIREIIQKEFAESALWGVKDPRLCLFLPLWQEVLQELQIEARFIVVLRNPLEIALSLARRDAIFPLHTLSLTQRYMGEVARNLSNKTYASVAYTDLLEDWVACLTKAADQLQLAWPVLPETLGGDAGGAIESALKHQNTKDIVGIEMQELMADAQHWRELRAYTPKPDAQLFLEGLVGFWKAHHERLLQLDARGRMFEKIAAERDAQLAERNPQLAERNAQLAERNAQLAERNAQLAERDAEIRNLNNRIGLRMFNWLGRLSWKRTKSKK